jgi:ABC-type dipeptide/oligopeptide/nickel transport system ATPase component
MSIVKWRKVDLHIHSNSSHDCTLTPEDIVQKLIDKNINAFSITDHNNVNNVDKFREIVNIRKQNGVDIEFFPGVELRTNRGKDGVAIHLVVIFPEHFNKQKIIDMFLSKEGIDLTYTQLVEKGRSEITDTSEDKLYKKGCEIGYVDFDKAISLANSLGALTIAVHPKDRAGIEKELDYQNRGSDSFAQLLIDSVKKIDIMELPKNIEKAIDNRKFYLNEKNNFIRVMPSVLSSDSHSLETIGSKFTYIKMDTLTFEALKQIQYEPKNRIFINENGFPIPKFPYIKKIRVNGGYYDSKEFQFSPELNCIIGGRGSGKSVIIDLLRFIFNKYEASNKDHQEYLDRLYNLLKYGNTITVEIEHDGKIFTVSRMCHIEKLKDRNGERLVDKSALPKLNDYDIELYSQGNLKQITRRANEQLKLIDDIGNNNKLLADIDKFRASLIKNSKSQLAILSDIKEDFYSASNREIIIQDIKDKENILTGETIKQFSLIQEDKKYYDLIIKNLEKLNELFRVHMEQMKELTTINFPNFVSEYTKTLGNEFVKIHKILINYENRKRAFLEDAINRMKNIKYKGSRWIDFYNIKENEYIKFLKENNLENLADETNQLKELKDNLLNIDNNILPRLNKRINEIQSLQTIRSNLLADYREKILALRKARKIVCNKISSSRDDLRISISQRLDKKEFQKHIELIVSGMNIKFKDAAANIVHFSSSIEEFCDDLNKQDLKYFEKKYKLTSDAAGKIFSKYGTELPMSEYQLNIISSELFELELLYFEDIIEIEIKDSNDGKFKKFSRFSPGQQCSYLLSILLDSSENPLIIDQPEDELDWNYISSFIDKLSSCKINVSGKGRQFIFVTHNQNITVLADSESIMRVKNIPIVEEGNTPTGELEAQGGIERKEVRRAVLSLEGGEDAFNKRKNRYGI